MCGCIVADTATHLGGGVMDITMCITKRCKVRDWCLRADYERTGRYISMADFGGRDHTCENFIDKVRKEEDSA
jgi:hypothetical protein